MDGRNDTLLDFISRPSGHGKRIAIIERRISGYYLVFGNPMHEGRWLAACAVLDLAYQARNWDAFEEAIPRSKPEPNANARR